MRNSLLLRWGIPGLTIAFIVFSLEFTRRVWSTRGDVARNVGLIGAITELEKGLLAIQSDNRPGVDQAPDVAASIDQIAAIEVKCTFDREIHNRVKRAEARLRESATLAAGPREAGIELFDVIDELKSVVEMLRRRLATASNTLALLWNQVLVLVVASCLLALILSIVFRKQQRDFNLRLRAEDEARRQQELLGAVVNESTDAIFVKDLQGRFLLVNSALARLLGQDAANMIGQQASAFLEPGAAQQVMQDDQKVLMTRQPHTFETVLKSDTGKILLTTKAPFTDADGNVRGIVGIARDITERKESEEAVRDYAEQLEYANRELDRFASAASHDLSEPLRKVQMFVDRLKKQMHGSLDDRTNQSIIRIQDSVHRMQKLIDNLLKLARISTARRPPEPVNLNETVNEVVADLEVLLANTGGEISLVVLPTVNADPVQMRQLFANLIGNGIKFHRKEHAPRVTITAEPFEGHSGGRVEKLLRIHVADNGIGLAAEHRERVFDTFFRVHGRREFDGTGIGLSICRQIANRHSGSIYARSTPDGGTCITVILPEQLEEFQRAGVRIGRDDAGQERRRASVR